MTLDELKAMCADADGGYPSDTVQIVVPPRMMPPRFPRGELLCVNSDGERVYRFKVDGIRRWIKLAEAELAMLTSR